MRAGGETKKERAKSIWKFSKVLYFAGGNKKEVKHPV